MAQGGVELWLGALMNMIFQSIHGIIRQAYYAINAEDFDILKFISMYPAQISLLGIQLMWTRDAEVALKSARHDKKKMTETNDAFLELLNILIAQTTNELEKFERVCYETIITIHVHQVTPFCFQIVILWDSPNVVDIFITIAMTLIALVT